MDNMELSASLRFAIGLGKIWIVVEIITLIFLILWTLLRLTGTV